MIRRRLLALCAAHPGLGDAVRGLDPGRLLGPRPGWGRAGESAQTLAMRRRLREEEQLSLMLALRGRLLVLGLTALLVMVLVPALEVLWIHAALGLFALLGMGAWWLGARRRRRRWIPFALATIDFPLLAAVLLFPNPLSDDPLPVQLAIQSQSGPYVFILLAGAAFSFRPSLVLYSGALAALSWWVGMQALRGVAGVVTVAVGERSQIYSDPQRGVVVVDLGVVLQECALFMLVALLLAMVVARSRRIVLSQALAEGDRARLAQYFAPALVNRLSAAGPAQLTTGEHTATVLFADLVGFTAWAEGHTPSEIIALLRRVHGRIQRAVFDHGGTMDKFLGDGLMASFGTPDPQPTDAAAALACLKRILAEHRAAMAAAEDAGLPLSIGLHTGTVVVGDIGSDQRLVVAVVGDTVNVAARLEAATRALGVAAVISDTTVAAARHHLEADDPIWTGLTARGEPLTLKNRSQPLAVWVLD